MPLYVISVWAVRRGQQADLDLAAGQARSSYDIDVVSEFPFGYAYNSNARYLLATYQVGDSSISLPSLSVLYSRRISLIMAPIPSVILSLTMCRAGVTNHGWVTTPSGRRHCRDERSLGKGNTKGTP